MWLHKSLWHKLIADVENILILFGVMYKKPCGAVVSSLSRGRYLIIRSQKIKKNSNSSIWSNKRWLQGFLGMLSPNLALIMSYLCSFIRFWPLLSQNTWQLFPVLCKMPSFWVKLGSQIFWNIRPWVKGCSAVTRSRIIPIRQTALNFTILLLKIANNKEFPFIKWTYI